MTKTTFLGYVPSLKSKHEATIVNGRAMKSKGGSIRYLLEGEYDGRKTLPKTVSKEDFVKVYGFDAEEAKSVFIRGIDKDGNKAGKVHVVGIEEKDNFIPVRIMPMDGYVSGSMSSFENHADTVGNPSPADVEPPAPSEKPFPQEPSNENFSADGASLQTYFIEQEINWENPEDIRDIIVDLGLEGNAEADLILNDDKALNEFADALKEYNETEVKEALGLFGKKDEKEEEKEESDEPKTQEFTVVLQEGDKLELTDIPEEKEEEVSEENEEETAAPEDENEEKEEETAEIEEKAAENVRVFVVSSVDYETDGEDQDELGLPQDFTFALDIDDIGDTTDMQEIADEIVDDISDETGFLVSGFYFQEKMPDGTLVDLDAETYEAVQAKVTRPVKEDETEDEEEESEEGLSTGAKVALGVGALAVGAAIFGAEGEYPQEFLDEFYDFDSNPTADTQDEETIAIAYAAWLESKKEDEEEARMLDETHSDIRDYIPYESETDYSRIYGASGSGEKEHDMIAREEEVMYEFRYDNPITTYDWTTAKETVSDEEEDYIHDAISDEIGSEPSEGEDNFEIDVDDVGSVDVDTYTDYGDKRHYGLAAEHESESDGYTYAYTKGHKDGMDNEVIYRPSIETDREKTIFKKILKQKADTVGNPSPSGPSSTPEPAEATGSEPSNEEFKSDNTKMALGILGIGIGAVALLGGDRIKKLFDRFG